MDTPITKEQLLEQTRHERALWDELLAEVGPEHMEQPGAMGEWTFKDVIAHMTAWRTRTLARLNAARAGTVPEATPWPEDLDTEEINEWIYNTNRDRPLEDVVLESYRVFDQIVETTAALSEQDLTEPQRFDWMEGRPLGETLRDSFEHYHGEHEAGLRAWLSNID